MKKNIISCITFLLIGILLFSIISIIIVPKWIEKDRSGIATLTIKGFYEEPKNTLDVLFFGNSGTLNGISPIILWKEFGITSYSCATLQQRLLVSYYMLKETLQYQKPALVVIDVDSAFSKNNTKETFDREVFDTMKHGKTKWEVLSDSAYSNSFYDKLTYIFPLLRYHTRWTDLDGRDFRNPFRSFYNPHKGYLLFAYKKPYPKKDYMKQKDSTKNVLQDSKVYLEKIIELCRKNNVQLLLTEMVSPTSWSNTKHNIIANFANQHQIPFLDLNEEDIGINWETDTSDSGYHLNVYGAEKITSYVGTYLKNHYTLIDHRTDPSYDQWNSDTSIYEQDKEKLLSSSNNQ